MWVGRCYCHLVDGAQRSCQTSNRAQGSPHLRPREELSSGIRSSMSSPCVHRAEVQKPSSIAFVSS